MPRKFHHLSAPTTTRKKGGSDAVERAVAGSSSERAARLVSISEFSRLTGRDRGTISKWIDKGCPVVSSGATGESTVVDVGEVMKWRENQARMEERAKFEKPGDDAAPPMSALDIKARKELAAARNQEMKLAQTAKIVIHREPMEFAYVEALAKVRQSVMSVPDRLYRDMAGLDRHKAMQWRLDALKTCRAGLKEAAKALNDMFLRMSEEMEPIVVVDEDDDD